MQFVVPQFIQRNTKILGPLSFKQVLFILAAALISLLFYVFLPFSLFVIGSLIVFPVCLALAVLRVHNTPLPELLKNFFIFLGKPRIYLWKKKKDLVKMKKSEIIVVEEEKEGVPLSQKSGLKDTLNKLSIK